MINFCVFIIPLASVNGSVHLLLLSLMGLLISGITHVRLASPYSGSFSGPQASLELETYLLFDKLVGITRYFEKGGA